MSCHGLNKGQQFFYFVLQLIVSILIAIFQLIIIILKQTIILKVFFAKNTNWLTMSGSRLSILTMFRVY